MRATGSHLFSTGAKRQQGRSAHRQPPRRRVRAALLALSLLLTGIAVVEAAAPASAAGPACTAAELKPTLKELMVSQGLPSYTSLVRGKDTLIRLFVTKPACASNNQTVTVKNITTTVANGAIPLGTGSTFSPTGTFTLPPNYTTIPAVNSPTDPIVTVKGNVLTPCGAQATCPTDTAGFSATFNLTLTYTTSSVTTDQTVTFSASKAVAQKSNALRILAVPMGNANQPSSTQYSTAADAALQQGMNTASRILPVPCNADPADPTGACFATSLLSQYGGVRYAVSPGILDLSAVPGAYDTTGKFCGTQSNFDALKGTLAQFLESWNTANPSTPADRVIGVVDEAISSGVGTSPTGFSCADGMAATGSVAAWVRAMYSTQPSRTGGILAMELTHTFGGVRAPRSFTTHSANSQADGTAPERAYDLTRRAYIAGDRSAMKYDLTSPWNNDTTLFEKLDQEFFLCHLGGPANSECTTSGTTGAITGSGAGITVVMTGTTGFTEATTEIVMSYRTNDVAQPEYPDPAAPDPLSSTRLLITGTGEPANLGVNTTGQDSVHDEDPPDHVDSDIGIIATAFEGVPGMTSFALYHCPSGTQACKDDPIANGGVFLYEAHKQPGPTTVGAITVIGAGEPQNWTQDPSRVDTNPAVQTGAVAWVARCSSCANGATTIHLAPESDRTKLVELPLSNGISQSDPVWRSDGLAVAWIAGGDIWKANVNRSTQPYTVSGAARIYAQGGANPAAAYPTWSPDGTRIYFGATNGGIRYIPVNGGNSSPLVSTPAGESQPTAGATLIAYTKRANQGGTDIWTVDPKKPSSTQKLLATNGDQPWFGADGRVLFRRGGKIMSVLANGTGLKQVSTGPDDQNPTSSISTLGFDRPFGSDREVVLANLNGMMVQSSVNGPLGPNTKGELRLTCADGSVFAMAVGVEVEQQSATQGTLTANYDDSRACGGTGTLQWVCTDGFDLCTQGPSSTLTVTNTNKDPVASITSPSAGTLTLPKGKVALNGSASSAQGPLTGGSLRWYVSGTGLPETFLGTGNRFDVSPPGGTWPSGAVTFRLEATDATGKKANATTYVVVDGIAPSGTVVSGPGPFTSSTTVTIAYTFSDSGGSTFVTQLCQLDGGEKAPCTSPVTYEGLTPGEHTVTIYIIDEAGNETRLVVDFIVDGVPPSTEVTLTPPPNQNGWNNTDVDATFTATDDFGVQSITYSLSGAQTGGATVPGDTASVTITAQGTTTITYSATDNAGRVEPTKQILVRIDKGQPPPPTITRTPSAAGIPNTCVTLVGGCRYEGNASDSLSGVAAVILHFDGGQSGSFDEVAVCTGCGAGAGPVTWSFTPAPLQLLLGSYTVTATAIDRAGNVSAPSAATVLHVI